MRNSRFVFKEFTIHHGKCSMKLCTDSILIGAWANKAKAKKILDIGTGCGVIALMLAQRTKGEIDSIDICEDSYLQAKGNFFCSKWGNRLTSHHCSLQQYSPKKKYDLIVSNPPYFPLPSGHKEKKDTQARYIHKLSYAELVKGVVKLLHPKGRFCVIFPVHEGAAFTNEAEKKKLFLTKYTWVKTAAGKKFPKRILMEFELSKKKRIKDSIFVIQDENGYTDEYKNLTKDYFLKF